MQPTFFDSPMQFRDWLIEHYASEKEILIGLFKKGSGQEGITYAEALDEALCFGWIDGVRKRIDDRAFTIRFSPRKRQSIWSAVNIVKVEELIELGRMQPSGLRAFNDRREARSKVYAYENETRSFDQQLEDQFRANPPAWTFFTAQPPSYRRTMTWWVMSAKREETRLRRLTTLMTSSEQGRRLTEPSGNHSNENAGT